MYPKIIKVIIIMKNKKRGVCLSINNISIFEYAIIYVDKNQDI